MLRTKMNWLIFWVSALATYRVTIMFSRELGPFSIFKRLRSLPLCGKLLTCAYCTSVYVASLICVLLWVSGVELSIPMWIILALAFSAVTVIADRTFTSDFQT